MRVERIGDATLYLGDCREVLPTLGRVDLVLTDPPYPREFQHLYGEMAEHAAALLPVGGSLVTLCGHYQTIEVGAAISQHLRFWWLAGMKHTMGTRLPGKWVFSLWKPALWFVKERRHSGDTECPVDLLEGGGQDKAVHEWGQPYQWFRHWIERLSEPGDVVLDPFCGAGTTGVAAAKLRRRFIGVELDPKHFENACRRIEAAYAQPDLFVKSPEPKPEQLSLLGAAE
jgi:site-specific DNA-methyltransferase (adenine-specific)